MNKIALLLLVISVVFIAGCIGQPEEERKGVATGVRIKSFGTEGITEIYSEESVTFSLTVENIGEEDATDVKAKLFGLGSDWEWEKGYKDMGDLYAMPESTGFMQWSPKSPSLKVDNTYTASVRVAYGYKTTARGYIKVYNMAYLNSLPLEERQKIMKSPGIEGFTVTDAPVTASLVGLAGPLFYREGEKEVRINIQIQNIGQGAAYLDSEEDRKVTIESITINEEQCENEIPESVTLPRGSGARSLTCEYTFEDITDFVKIPIEIDLSYNYFIDGSSSIKVLKEIF